VYGALLFFVWVPILGIVAAVIRKLAGYKKANVWVRSSFVALWVVGWILLFYFGSSLGHSFSKHNVPEEQTVSLVNPGVDYLEVTASPKLKYYENRWFQISPFDAFSDEDTVYVRNLRIRIVQSKTDSFQVKVVKLSNGKTVQNANDLASKINFDLTQQDSLVYLDRGIAINKKDKFRNQHIIMTIAVPVGKRIKIPIRVGLKPMSESMEEGCIQKPLIAFLLMKIGMTNGMNHGTMNLSLMIVV
jgi:hypothetical protein